MKTQSLKVTLKNYQATYQRVILFVEERKDVLPGTYIIRNEDISKLCELANPVKNRGMKDKRKGLSEYLLGKNKDEIRTVDGNFSNIGALKKGINAFLPKANLENVYFIGLNSEFFDLLWEMSGSENEEKEKRKFDVKINMYYPDIDSADEIVCQLLHELIERCDVPKELEEKYVGHSWKVDLVRRFIVLAAQRDVPVLILGDTGTGKEIVANQIHLNSGRTGNFLAVNCGGISANLFEAELFGYEPGCFTGADPRGKIGLWESADNGTLFLDEIGDLPLDQQAKILRALQERKIRRLCGTKDIDVNARIITATNRNLLSMVQRGQFREDLYYRLRGFLIHTPALKDHPEDIPVLAKHFWQTISRNKDKDFSSLNIMLPPDILKKLQLYRWPGNARELKMVLNHLYTFCDKKKINTKDLTYVFYLQGQNWSTQSSLMLERSADLLKGDCWRHLKRVDEIVMAVKSALMPLIGKKKVNEKIVETVLTYLDFHLGELNILCREHMLFYSDKTFSSVAGFMKKINVLHDHLHADVHKAREYLNDSLVEEFETITGVIFKECEKILGNR